MISYFVQQGMGGAPSISPFRIMQAIITGISFLGAGTIIFKDQQSTVEGLTTAASILFVSGIGMAVAVNQISMAIILTLLAIGILFGIGFAEDWINKSKASRT